MSQFFEFKQKTNQHFSGLAMTLTTLTILKNDSSSNTNLFHVLKIVSSCKFTICLIRSIISYETDKYHPLNFVFAGMTDKTTENAR